MASRHGRHHITRARRQHPASAASAASGGRGERDFWWLWSGQTASSLGTQTAALALPLLALATTGSPTAAGVIGFAAGLPGLLLQLPAGALVDRGDRRRIMRGCDAGRLVLTVSLPVAGLLGGLSYGWLLVVAVGNTTLGMLFTLAQSATLPRVVTPARLPRAIARNQASRQGALLAGQPLGGWLYGLHPLLPFVVDAASFTVSWLTLTAIRTTLSADPDRTDRLAIGARARLHDLRRETGDGLRYLWRQPVLRTLALLAAATTLCCGGFTLAVIVLLNRLGTAPATIGIILGCAGAAGLAGAALTPLLIARLGPRRCYLASLTVSAALAAGLSQTHSALLVGGAAAGIVAVGPPAAAVLQVARAHTIPDHLFARVRAAETTIATSTAPLSSLLTGLALTHLGPTTTCEIIAAGLAAITLAAATHPELHHLHRPN